ncbi:MAG: tRNA guanosine(34) transglycosylase Tgt [Candidatus Komeilibacteria bacterium CG_4_10_14_0_2_um_filter_37_10]|uniref:Queuine tRNA-ribosyltransferase n=1 Tax=Candidatus Komeilibacteria bacterium CG_4_10_14_0_2_um_filter_37_10 TaxID=1974470 RepID=A0A2M7VFX8_9BACT|nr:MAG: tRNA guanosine(34) transglycosylase Tgt [Candidatus Komeilibacteria bacterium CG_4_10_14_0_2_um_filter_37_10]
MNNFFKLQFKSKKSKARCGILNTAHGCLATPFFMTIATRGVVKSVTTADLQRLKIPIILANTYHLFLRPSLKILKRAGGLHQFMNWSGPILTDSGGFQIFSLDGEVKRKGISQQEIKVDRLLTDQGVEFVSYLDGSKHFFSPADVIRAQKIIGSDLMMVLDECVAYPASYEVAKKAVDRTLLWAEKSIKSYQAQKIVRQKLFGIVQGSTFSDLRLLCARELAKMNFAGLAIGGLAVGEKNEQMYQILDELQDVLPVDKPRYLMGVGYPDNIVAAVKRGVDMFDCVIPTREARHARLYIRLNQRVSKINNYYQTINLNNAAWALDKKPINSKSVIPELCQYSLSYLHHLFKINDPLALRLATLHNIEFYYNLMNDIRVSIKKGDL